MSDKPNVTVIYQDSKQDSNMGCAEWILGIIVMLGFASLVTGLTVWQLITRLWL